MNSVGRPPEVDSQGEVVQKSLVNVTIPSKLANFLKKKGINRSKLFTKVVRKMYDNELCNLCYGTRIEQTKIGCFCLDCDAAGRLHYTKLKNCPNCESQYQPPYNLYNNSKEVKDGCWDCCPPSKDD